MFLPVAQRPLLQDYACVIVGSGPAGITVALELEKLNLRALVIESEHGNGDLALSVGYGHYAGDYWNAHWIRAFGGTSNAWAGWLATLREIDFDHPVVGVPWPIDRATLLPYYRRAAPVLGRRHVVADFEREVLPGWTYRPFSTQSATRFGDEYRGVFERSKIVDVALGYSVVGFGATASRSSITSVRCFDHRTGTTFDTPIRADQSIVVAAGGIGNAQLLLQPPEDGGTPIGNEGGHVGKYLMEHPHLHDAGECVTDLDLTRYAPPGLFGRAMDAIALDGATEAEHQLIGCSLELKHRTADHELARHFSTGDRPFFHYGLNARSEMLPTASNRVQLTAERSRSGLYRVAAHCVISAGDLLNVEYTLRLLGDTLTRLGRGRVRVNNDEIYRSIAGGGHIMGTTRMGSSRSSSVVDADCRVHGYNNFFVAGSSVFTTGGYANPTFTIVALAVRLAEEIANRG